MKYIADLHIHSPYSRATSKKSDLNGLFAWAGVKGIQVVGTGDFTHPAWFAELRENLEEAEPGFFKLKDESVPTVLPETTPQTSSMRFVLTAEISCIYKKNGKTRKIHAILLVPDFEAAKAINSKLSTIGNIESDGRPILGLDVRNLLEILLENSENGFMVPAHIWTPWFSLFGSKSGFDTIDECFEDLSSHIFALETGLSSDPEMIRTISSLDRFTLISNSDCHSPSKLGREANLFDTGFDFFRMKQALQEPSKGGFKGTIEFYPEEGKYHQNGHRKCGVCLTPEETIRYRGICPICKKPLTIGVMHRISELADRKHPVYPKEQERFTSLIPLVEILSEILGVGAGSKKVLKEYSKLINQFGSEFDILMDAPVDMISQLHSTTLAEGINRLRNRNVIRKPGFDGEYGMIRLFKPGELEEGAE